MEIFGFIFQNFPNNRDQYYKSISLNNIVTYPNVGLIYCKILPNTSGIRRLFYHAIKSSCEAALHYILDSKVFFFPHSQRAAHISTSGFRFGFLLCTSTVVCGRINLQSFIVAREENFVEKAKNLLSK